MMVQRLGRDTGNKFLDAFEVESPAHLMVALKDSEAKVLGRRVKRILGALQYPEYFTVRLELVRMDRGAPKFEVETLLCPGRIPPNGPR